MKHIQYIDSMEKNLNNSSRASFSVLLNLDTKFDHWFCRGDGKNNPLREEIRASHSRNLNNILHGQVHVPKSDDVFSMAKLMQKYGMTPDKEIDFKTYIRGIEREVLKSEDC